MVRKLKGDKDKYFLSNTEIASLGKIVDLDRILLILKEEKIITENMGWPDIPFYRPLKGEGDESYKGRVGIHEVLKITPAIRDLIIGNASSDKIEDQAKKEGMITMIEDGIFKCVQGFTTIEEVLRVVSE